MTNDRDAKTIPFLSAEDSIAAMDKLPDEALQSLLDNFARISGEVAVGPGATPEMLTDSLRWRALSAEMRRDSPQCRAKVRAELRTWFASPQSPLALPLVVSRKSMSTLRARRSAIAAFVGWSAFVLYRTFDSHTLAGFYLERWSEEDLLQNWLGLPAAVALSYLVGRWALGSGEGLLVGRKVATLKRPSELGRTERVLHLLVYPLLLVPLGLYFVAGGLDDDDLGRLVLGVVVATSPFWALVRLRDVPPSEETRPK